MELSWPANLASVNAECSMSKKGGLQFPARPSLDLRALFRPRWPTGTAWPSYLKMH